MDPVHKLFRKAERIISEGRVVRISPYMFYVIGDHGKYFVYVDKSKVKCLCPGYRKRGYCSHSISVLLILLRKEYREALEKGLRDRLEHQLELIKAGRIHPR